MMDHKDKLLHKRMAQARTALKKVAAELRENKSGEWIDCAKAAGGFANILSGWVEQIEKEGEKK